MKKITLLLALIAVVGIASATVYIDETFNYSVSNLADESTWTTTLTGVTSFNGTGRNIITPPLTYSNSGGEYILSNTGKTIYSDYLNTANALYTASKPIGTTISTTVYVSFLYKAGVAQTQGQSSVFGLATGTNHGSSLWVGRVVSGESFKFGVTRSSTTSTDIKWGTAVYTDVNEVFLIVLKHDFGTGYTSLYVNPTIGGTEPETPEQTDNAGTARTSLNNLWFRNSQNNAARFNISGVRVSSTWAEAVAKKMDLPALTAPVVGTASSVGAESFTANWTAVSNATGYTVNVYQGVALYGTYNANGQATESLEIKGLLTNTTYTYKVIAKGDGAENSNSVESDASAQFTTLEGLTVINTNFNDGTWGEFGATAPAAADFPTSSYNGFDLIKTFQLSITRTDWRGETKENGLRIARLSVGGMVVMPTVKSLEQIEIHIAPGTVDRPFVLKELVNGVWTTVHEQTMASNVYNQYVIPLSRTTPTKLRIENSGGGEITLYQIITRTTNPALLDAPVVGVPSAPNATYFNANWSVVPNATAYKVRVYQGSTLVKTVEASGQSTESVGITGLEPETEYTYKVLAVGDGFVYYADSYLSAASSPVTTGPSTSVDNVEALKLYVTGKSIVANETGTFEVYSLQGSKIYQRKNAVIAHTGLPEGIYILQFTNADGKKKIQKIVIN
jgi:hypothetical protein